MSDAGEIALRVEGLRVGFTARHAPPLVALEGVDLTLGNRRIRALVGESGSGKSLTGLAIMRLLAGGGHILDGRILLAGTDGSPSRDLASSSETAMRTVRGAQIGMVFQEPMTALNPQHRIGAQIAEPLRAHRGLSRTEAERDAIGMLRRVGIPAPEDRARAFPHQLSGGMRQRVMIAIALCCRPAVLIADEPTTALDVTTQAQILALLRDLQDEFAMATLFITHNLAVVAECADDVSVMYAGRIVEEGPVADVLAHPRHPYTRALLNSLPGGAATRSARLPTIPGAVPPPGRRPQGCAFRPRCALAIDACGDAVPPLALVGNAGHRARCIRPDA